MPLSSRDFQRAARQRLETALLLYRNHHNLDAMYLAGYTVECSLKALILGLTPGPDRAAMFDRISRGNAMHYPENLSAILRTLDKAIPLELVKKYRRFAWSTDLRYESGRTPTGETGGFLRTAQQTYEWVEGELP